MTVNIQKWGNSRGIRIPKILLEILQWNDDEKVSLNAENNKIVIEKAKDKVTLSSLFENYDEDYTPERVDWGKPVGREIW